MGKNKNIKDKKGVKKFIDDNEEEISEFEKLRTYAEKKGKNIWEVTLEDLEEEDDMEEEEEALSHDEIEVEEDTNKEQANSDLNTLEEDKIILNGNDIIPFKDSNDKLNDNNNDPLDDDKINLGLSQLKLGDTQPLENKYPLIVKVNQEITKIIQVNDVYDGSNHNEMNGNSFVKFGNKKVIFEYPKEDTNPKPAETKNKKKKNAEPEVKVEKQDKKKKKKELEDDINEEDFKRLEEARRKREEFAYLEKCRLEEEEERRKEEKAQKFLEDDKKQKEKNKYKPKGKKKKGK